MALLTGIHCTYDTGHKQTCTILLPHESGADVLRLAQAYFDAKYGSPESSIYGSRILSAKSAVPEIDLRVDFARVEKD